MTMACGWGDCIPHTVTVACRTRVRGRPPKRTDGPHASMLDAESRWKGLDGMRTTSV